MKRAFARFLQGAALGRYERLQIRLKAIKPGRGRNDRRRASQLLWDYWGQGLAKEGERALANHAFEVLKLDEIVAFTVPINTRSRRVMDMLGMTHDSGDDFDHPRLPEGHQLRRHVLYCLRPKDQVNPF